MNWKCDLEKLEHSKEWDKAIALMQEVLEENPNDLDAYLAINYLLMNLLVEEDYNESKHDYYKQLTKRYFDESRKKFSNNPEYLYFIGTIAYMSEWYFDIEVEDARAMLDKALALEPSNELYQWTYYLDLAAKDRTNKSLISYASRALDSNSPIRKFLQPKGALGAYILGMLTHWSKRILDFETDGKIH